MDSLSKVSAYLNEMENVLDDGDSAMKVEELVEVGMEMERVNVMDVIDAKEKDMLNIVGFMRLNYGDYGRKMVKDVRVGIHGYVVQANFVMVDYVNEGEPSINKDVDTLLENLVENMVEVGNTSGKLVKMEKILEALERKYQELEEKKPIVEVLKNYMVYRNKLDEVLMGRARLENKDHMEEDRERIVEKGLPKKLSDPGNFVLPVRVNGVTHLSALVDTRASVSVLPYSLYKNFGLDNPRPYHSNLTMTDNTQAKAMGEIDQDEDSLGCFELGRDEDENQKYGLIAPSFLEIKDEMERALGMEGYFNPFKNIIVFKKLIDFLGSLPVQLKSIDWGSKGYGVYKKTEGDGVWHAKFEVITPSGRKFTMGFKTKETKRKLSDKFTSEDILD
ncbi:DNA-directed DNA polymerase [Tanacetum coccineum]|uniref:DNA-directed DNA polymerase n=1 Tax=Tanacetum coccineum TaxID=301880 RepID=A0ABQ5AU19_9ASTR